MSFCRKCGFQLSDTARFCPRCGMAVPKPTGGKTCPYCGQPVKPESKFCQKCGGKLEVLPAGAPKAEQKKLPIPVSPNPICPACGKPVRKGAKFCASCGAVQQQNAAQFVPPPVVPQKTVPKVQNPIPAGTVPRNVQPVGNAITKAPPAPKAKKKSGGILVLNLVLSAACIIMIVAGVRIIPEKIQQVRVPVQVFEEVELGPGAWRDMEILESGGTLIQPLPEEYVCFGHHNPEDWGEIADGKEGEENEK